MKKVLGLIAIFAVSSMAMAGEAGKFNVVPKIGFDVSSEYVEKTDNHEYTYDGDSMGYTFEVQGTYNIIKDLEVGAGIGYSIYSEMKNQNGQGIDSIPVYALGRYTIGNFNEFKPYVEAQFGYAINDFKKSDATLSINNGLVYGAGVGVEYKNIMADLMYKVNSTTFDWEQQGFTGQNDFTYSAVTLSVGYKFEM